MIILEDIAHAQHCCYPQRYHRCHCKKSGLSDMSTPCIANCPWQYSHSLCHRIIMTSQKYVFETCFIRREERFMSHPWRISAFWKSLLGLSLPRSPSSPSSPSLSSSSSSKALLQIHFQILPKFHKSLLSRSCLPSPHFAQFSVVDGNSHLKQMLIRKWLAAETPY